MMAISIEILKIWKSAKRSRDFSAEDWTRSDIEGQSLEICGKSLETDNNFILFGIKIAGINAEVFEISGIFQAFEGVRLREGGELGFVQSFEDFVVLEAAIEDL